MMAIDEKGRCCGRKVVEYKRREHDAPNGYLYCGRCSRSYNREDKEQIPSWAWKPTGPNGEWEWQPGTPAPGKYQTRRERRKSAVEGQEEPKP